MRLLLICSALLPLLSLTGCGVFNETRYLAVVDSQDHDKVTNWLKIEISGSSWLSSARYLSDFFDPTAVSTFFGTFSQPPGGQAPKTLVGVDNKGGTGQDLILLLSTNADAFADAVGSLAQSESIATDLVRLANKEKYADITKSGPTPTEIAQSKEAAQQIYNKGEDLFKSVGTIDPKDPGQVNSAQQKILLFATQLAAATGRKTQFNSVKDLESITAPPTTQK